MRLVHCWIRFPERDQKNRESDKICVIDSLPLNQKKSYCINSAKKSIPGRCIKEICYSFEVKAQKETIEIRFYYVIVFYSLIAIKMRSVFSSILPYEYGYIHHISSTTLVCVKKLIYVVQKWLVIM